MWADSTIMEIKSQVNLNHRDNEYRNIAPYAIRYEIEADLTDYIKPGFLRDLFKTYNYRQVLKVLRKHKISRWVRCPDGDLVPRQFKSKSTLYLQARSNGFNLAKAI